MPNIFDEEEKQALRIQMLNNGFQLIKKNGMKQTKVIDITQSVNISKGTFYNFFESKEEFVKEIIAYKREEMKKFIRSFVTTHENMQRDDLKTLVSQMTKGDFNLFPYLTNAEAEEISSKHEDFVASENKVHATTDEMLRLIAPHGENCDWQLVANYIRIIAITQSNQDKLIPEAFSKSIAGIFELILDEIYGPAQ